ncbi:hypothetical protein [Acinetobacter larvae]|nr:hypothetical protein [Acinetobacter larvae]
MEKVAVDIMAIRYRRLQIATDLLQLIGLGMALCDCSDRHIEKKLSGYGE